MRKLLFLVFFLTGIATPFVAYALDTEKVILNLNKQIKGLKTRNRELLGKIEEIEAQQQLTIKKLDELSEIIKFQATKGSENIINVLPNQSLKVSNEDALKLYKRGRSYLLTQQFEKSIDSFSSYLELYPSGEHLNDSRYWLIKSFLAKGDFTNAESLFVANEEKLRLHYKYPNLLFDLAKNYKNNKDFDNSILLITRLIDNFPNNNRIENAKEFLNELNLLKNQKLTQSN